MFSELKRLWVTAFSQQVHNNPLVKSQAVQLVFFFQQHRKFCPWEYETKYASVENKGWWSELSCAGQCPCQHWHEPEAPSVPQSHRLLNIGCTPAPETPLRITRGIAFIYLVSFVRVCLYMCAHMRRHSCGDLGNKPHLASTWVPGNLDSDCQSYTVSAFTHPRSIPLALRTALSFASLWFYCCANL